MRRRWSAALVLLLLSLPVAVTTSTASAAPAAATARAPVVLVGVPDLRWQDVDPAGTPTLWGLAGRSAVAAMTDRSGEPVTSRAAGWVSLNTGSRARADAAPGTVPDPTAPAQFQVLRAVNDAARYQAQVGALGDALRGAGLAVATVGGPGALLGVTAGDGTVGARATSVAAALPTADVVVVELPQLYQVDRRDVPAVRRALAAIDHEVGTVLAELPASASLLVAGVSDGAAGAPHLHVAMAAGPSFPPGLLTSASTGRDGVVQLIDVAPTMLSLAAVPVPARMLGAAWRAVPDPEATTASRLAALVELDRRSIAAQAVVRWYYPAVAWTALLFVLVTVTAWRRGRVRALRPLGAVVASVPVAGYLAQLVPWWRAGGWALLALTVGVAATLGLSAACLPWARQGPWRTAAVIAGATAGVVVIDACTGSPLSLDAPFGDNPLIAGRFHGIGNVAFALLGAGTLVVAAAAATGRAPRRAAATVLGLGAVAVVVDGLPALGDDFGGVLALVPAVAVLVLAVSRVRVAGRHVLAAVGVAVTVTAAFALYDHSRPPAQRTHLGRFIGQLVDGSAAAVVHRKLDSSLSTFTGGYARWIVLGWVVLAVAAWLAHRAGRLRALSGVDPHTARGLLSAVGVLTALGAALNDSGLEIPAFGCYLAAPLLVPLAAPVPEPPPPLAPAPGRAGSANAVRP